MNFLAEEVNSASTAVLPLFVAIPSCSLCPDRNMDQNSSCHGLNEVKQSRYRSGVAQRVPGS